MNIWSKSLLIKKEEPVEPEEKIKLVKVWTQADRFDPHWEEPDPSGKYDGIIHLYRTSARNMVFYPEVMNDSLTDGYKPYEEDSLLNSSFSTTKITITNDEERDSWMYALANGKDDSGNYILKESIMQIIPVVGGVSQIDKPVATYLIQFHWDKTSHSETEV